MLETRPNDSPDVDLPTWDDPRQVATCSQNVEFNRRVFLHRLSAISCAMTRLACPSNAHGATRVDASSRVSGMLMGSLVGDALGGPVEFLDRDKSRAVLPNARDWDRDRMLDATTLQELADSLHMLSYETLRPDTAAYGPWSRQAKAGTVTDDSRHKMIVMRALQKMISDERQRITDKDLAKQFLAFQPHRDRIPEAELARLVEEGLREYRYAARWVLGERENALPVERLWAGVSNCSGQMALLPLAGLFPGDPLTAYRETYAIDFLDAPIARDICSAINAALAAALDEALNEASPQERWKALLTGLRTDPFRYADVPFAGRQLDRWLDLSDSIVERAAGQPASIYRLLEQEGRPVYYWDAHFTLLVPLTMLKACRFDPLAAMHLTLDFGHDSDSYAQVLGAMVGAVHGINVFPDAMVNAVADRLNADFGESVDQWESTLSTASSLWVSNTDR